MTLGVAGGKLGRRLWFLGLPSVMVEPILDPQCPNQHLTMIRR